MNDVDLARKGFDSEPWVGEHGPEFDQRRAWDALARIEAALRALTAEHGSQCRCQGCTVLRDGA